MDDETRAALELTADDLRRMWDEGRPVRIAKSPPRRENPMSKVIEYLPRMSKALVAAFGGWSAAYAGALDGGVSADEWIVVAAAGVAAAVAVWFAPNREPEPT